MSDKGPGTLTTYHVGANGTLDTTIAETTVTFDGLPAPIIYTSSTQVSVMVPYGVAGRGRVNMIVTYKNVSSIPFGINVVDVAPGLYTLNATSTTPVTDIAAQAGMVGPRGNPWSVAGWFGPGGNPISALSSCEGYRITRCRKGSPSSLLNLPDRERRSRGAGAG